MSEPLAERLSRFTPDGGKLDRDGLLFAAGRASARPNRTWKAAAGALAASQLLTLLFLWPHISSTAPPAPPVAVQPPPAPAPAPANTDSWAANWRLLRDSDEPPPAADFVPDDPPLRACAADSPLVN